MSLRGLTQAIITQIMMSVQHYAEHFKQPPLPLSIATQLNKVPAPSSPPTPTFSPGQTRGWTQNSGLWGSLRHSRAQGLILTAWPGAQAREYRYQSNDGTRNIIVGVKTSSVIIHQLSSFYVSIVTGTWQGWGSGWQLITYLCIISSVGPGPVQTNRRCLKGRTDIDTSVCQHEYLL